jgi:hypothetical protein
MQHLFEYSGTTPTANELRRQPFDADSFQPLDQGATTLLTILTDNNGLPPIATPISQKEFKKGFRKW